MEVKLDPNLLAQLLSNPAAVEQLKAVASALKTPDVSGATTAAAARTTGAPRASSVAAAEVTPAYNYRTAAAQALGEKVRQTGQTKVDIKRLSDYAPTMNQASQRAHEFAKRAKENGVETAQGEMDSLTAALLEMRQLLEGPKGFWGKVGHGTKKAVSAIPLVGRMVDDPDSMEAQINFILGKTEKCLEHLQTTYNNLKEATDLSKADQRALLELSVDNKVARDALQKEIAAVNSVALELQAAKVDLKEDSSDYAELTIAEEEAQQTLRNLTNDVSVLNANIETLESGIARSKAFLISTANLLSQLTIVLAKAPAQIATMAQTARTGAAGADAVKACLELQKSLDVANQATNAVAVFVAKEAIAVGEASKARHNTMIERDAGATREIIALNAKKEEEDQLNIQEAIEAAQNGTGESASRLAQQALQAYDRLNPTPDATTTTKKNKKEPKGKVMNG